MVVSFILVSPVTSIPWQVCAFYFNEQIYLGNIIREQYLIVCKFAEKCKQHATTFL